jgi:carbon-monoxide dehydrogenase medium subunit
MLLALRSRRHIAPFAAHRPSSMAEALALHTAPGASAYLAGGVDLIDWMKQGNALDRVIRLDGLPGLAAITSGPDGLRIGAGATHAAIAASPVIYACLPDLAALWTKIANPRVRHAGTIGGNVMAGRNDYDGMPALLALGASAAMATETGETCVTLGQLSGLVTRFLVPDPGACRLYADRSLRPAVTVWLGLTVAAGQVSAMRLAAGMAHPQPVCVTLPLDLPVAALGAQAARIATAALNLLPEPTSDSRASAAYRRRMVGVLARRILVRAGGAA